MCEHEPKYAKGLCRPCYWRAYRAANLEKLKATSLAWAKAHPEKSNAWAKAHPEEAAIRAAANTKKWAAANPEKARQRLRSWRAKNPTKVKAQKHRRRAGLQGNGGSWTPAEWETLKRQLGYRCVGCWKTEAELTALGRKLVPDHIVPIVKDGLNHITNIQPLCHGRGGCNNKKSKKYQDCLIA